MPAGRTGPEREHALESHGHYYNDDTVICCYYHNHIVNKSSCVAGATKSDSDGSQNAPKYAF